MRLIKTMEKLNKQWGNLLHDYFNSDNYLALKNFLVSEYSKGNVFPPQGDIFNALRLTDYKNVKCVIIGQDPYHGYGQAHGLCFSVNEGVTSPPSLVNIYKEINSDLNISINKKNGNLTKWANQGVLLLNAVLTVREREPGSHRKKGWEQLTDLIIKALNEREEPMVFLLWGAFAKAKKPLITNPAHLILEAVHPSPLSAYNGFFGCRHFSQTNHFLKQSGMVEIDWSL